MDGESRPCTPPPKRNEQGKDDICNKFETSSEKLREEVRQKKEMLKEFTQKYEKPRERPQDPLERPDLYELNGTVRETIQYVDNVIDYKKKTALAYSKQSQKACSPRTKKVLVKNMKKPQPKEIIQLNRQTIMKRPEVVSSARNSQLTNYMDSSEEVESDDDSEWFNDLDPIG